MWDSIKDQTGLLENAKIITCIFMITFSPQNEFYLFNNNALNLDATQSG